MSSSLGLVSIENGITWIDEVVEGIEFSGICGMILLSWLVLWSHLVSVWFVCPSPSDWFHGW